MLAKRLGPDHKTWVKIIKKLLTILVFFLGLLSAGGQQLPHDLGPYGLNGVRVYKTQAMGFSVRYENTESTRKFDVYFYDKGKTALQAGLTEEVQAEFESAINDIKKTAELGYYADLGDFKISTGSVEIPEGKLKYRQAVVDFRYTEKLPSASEDHLAMRTSFIFLTAYNERFIKLRYTAIGPDREQAEREFAEIVGYLEEEVFLSRAL